MTNRFLLSSSLLLASLILGTTVPALADVSDQLKQADKYSKNKQYEQAEKLCQDIASRHTGTDYAFQAQEKLTSLYVTWGNEPQAQAALQKLLSDFSGHDDIAAALWRIAGQYNQAKKYEKASQIHKYNVENFPEDMYAMWSQVEIVYSHIREGGFTAADAAFDKLVTTFSDQPTLPKEIYQVARKYNGAGKTDKALSLHQQNVERFPNDVHATWSQAEIIFSHIRDGDDGAADAAFNDLLTVFSEHPNLPNEIYQVARKYNDAGKTEKALSLHQQNLERFSNDVHAMWSQVEIVFSHIRDGDDGAADAAFNELLTVFADQPTLSKEVYVVASRFSKSGNNQKARQLYQYLIDTWSADADIDSRKFVVMSYISLGPDAEVQVAIDDLTEDFKDHPDLPLVLWQASEAYYNQAFKYESEGLDQRAREYFNRVISMGKEFIEKSPDSPDSAEAHYILAICCERVKQYPKAIEYYQKVVDNWPHCKYAWKAQFGIAKMYKWSRLTDAMSHSESDAAAKAALEALVQNYPDCPAAEGARKWLGRTVESTKGAQK